MKKLLLLLLLIPLVSAVQILAPVTTCDEHGLLEMKVGNNFEGTIYTEDFKVLARKRGESNYQTIPGEWDSMRLEKKENIYFTSERVQLRHKAIYDLRLNYLDINNQEQYTTAAVECPGILYNCELFNITIEDCYTKDNEFQAYLFLGGIKPSDNPNVIVLDPEKDFDYVFRAQLPFEDVNDNIAKTGSLPKKAEFTKLSNERYLIKYTLEDNAILSLRVSYSAANLGECPQNYDIPDELMFDATHCRIVEEGEDVEEDKTNGEVSASAGKSYTPYIIIGGFILAGFILIAWVLKRK